MRALFNTEILKLTRQPAILFWGFLCPSLLALLFRIVLEALVFVRTGPVLPGNADLFLPAAKASGITGNALAHLLYAIGISTVFFTEYRFSTWRLLVPRHSRWRLWAAKFLTCLACLYAGLLVAVIGDMVLSAGLSILSGRGPATILLHTDSLFTLIAALGIAALELAMLTAIVSTLTILTRSMIAAAIPVFILTIAASVLQIYSGPLADLVPLPSYGAEALRAGLFSGENLAASLKGLAIMVSWLAVAAAAGALAFYRQQLPTE